MVIHKYDKDIKGTSMDYRPDIQVLDCTVRDGSLINQARFTHDFVKAVYKACVEAGVDYMEVGYKASKKIVSETEFGPWKFSTEEDLRRALDDNPSDMKISVMADVGRTVTEDILPASESVIDMIRVACYIHQIPAALDIVKDVKDKGYEACLNLMAISVVPDRELNEGLETICKSDIDVLYLVDSYGSLYFQPIRDLCLTYLDAVKDKGIKVGIHAHNNMQLAVANTIEALVLGASIADATLNGMGRGAGNCPLEILLAFLKNPKFKIRPILECIAREVQPLRNQMDWGYQVPYLITGMLNEHPRDAIQFLNSDEREEFLKFYDKMTEN